MWGIIKQPSGKNGIAVEENGRFVVLSGNKGDLLFWQIEAELQQQQKQKDTKATADKPSKK